MRALLGKTGGVNKIAKGCRSSGSQGTTGFPSRNARHVVLQIKRAEEKSHRRRQLELHGLHVVVVIQHGPSYGISSDVEGDIRAEQKKHGNRFKSFTGGKVENLAEQKQYDISNELGGCMRSRVDFSRPAGLNKHPDDHEDP